MPTSIPTLNPSLIRPVVFRTLALWLIVHVAWANMGESFVLLPLATAGLAVVAAIVGLLDARRRHELLFLQNLGMSPTIIALTCAATIMAAELAAVMLIVPLRQLIS